MFRGMKSKPVRQEADTCTLEIFVNECMGHLGRVNPSDQECIFKR